MKKGIFERIGGWIGGQCDDIMQQARVKAINMHEKRKKQR